MWTLRLLIAVCMLIGIRGLGIAWTTFTQLDLYREAQAAGSPVLRMGINAVFGFALFGLAWGLWRRKTWAYERLLPPLVLYALFNGLWLAAYAQADYDRGRLAFVGVTSALGVGFITWLRWRVRTYFIETKHDANGAAHPIPLM